MRSAFNKDAQDIEAVLLVLVNPEDDVKTLNCVRRPNTDDIEREQVVQIAELIEAGYVLVGLLVLPPSGRIDDYIDALGVLRWPAETWESCRSIEESKAFIAQVADQLAPASYHLCHVPNG